MENNTVEQKKMEEVRRKLECKIDPYNGVLVDSHKLPTDLVIFGELLQSTVSSL